MNTLNKNKLIAKRFGQNRSIKIELIIEKNDDGHYWARIENKGNFMPTGQGATVDKVLKNVKDSIEDYIHHEGKKDKFWGKIKVANISFEIKFDIRSFFEQFNELKISSIARNADLNESLVRQYATGNKYASPDQAKKIEKTLNDLGSRLQKVRIYA